MQKETKKKIGEWLMDVAKYMLTAVVISTIFKDFEKQMGSVYCRICCCYTLSIHRSRYV